MSAASVGQAEVRHSAIGRAKPASKRAPFLDKHFYFLMSLLIPAVVFYGFSHTVRENLLDAAPPRPTLLWIHGALFVGWLCFFLFQSVLVQTHNVKLHRTTGWIGAGLAATMVLVGVSTAIVMGRFHLIYPQPGAPPVKPFLIVPLFDMVCFSTFFSLAILWRKKSEFHRRLILIATCGITSAAFGRFPPAILPRPWFYVGVDLLILLGVARDLIVNRRIHQVYLYALPPLAACQLFVVYSFTHYLPWWQKVSNLLLG
ncbi:MAG TPA: hypothetical protein VMH00_13860 [Candidatus Limnocylindrales bacterium]|nr:hypothetical protein [Candidatus Limnocylindrales bacterium]